MLLLIMLGLYLGLFICTLLYLKKTNYIKLKTQIRAKQREKYNYSGPRYTSYPTALEFNEQFTEQDFILATNLYPERPLSLYVHIPFCHKLCYFCGCNKLITRQTHKVTKYLDVLDIEIAKQSALFKNRTVTQMHWGGGTPTFLTDAEISRLLSSIKKHFNFAQNAELPIEIDPREIK